jgi:hypothetical protein
MQEPYPSLAARFLELITPNETDVRRATRRVLSTLDDGRSHFTGELVRAVCSERGAPPDTYSMTVRFIAQPTPENVREDDPILAGIRARWAALEAVAELAAQGLIVQAHGASADQEFRNYEGVPERIGFQHPSGGTSVLVPSWAPAVSEAYRLAYGARRGAWYLEPNLFLEEISGLDLDARARRALQEALVAYRRGLYLASVSMLGVVFEAAWYGAAHSLGPTGALGQAVQQERTARVQELVAARLHNVRGVPPTLPRELLAHAALLRDLRNDGVHPAGPVRDDLERYLEEEACGLLILQTHHYLTRLAGAVDTATGTPEP